MKKYLFLIIALCYAVVANAQGSDQYSAILQHNETTTFYTGSTAFQQAYEAAVDGDVIVLSEGVFTPVTRIEKSLKIYGAGFERNAETNTAITAISGELKVGNANIILDGFHMEGILIQGDITFECQLTNSSVVKCYTTEIIRFCKNIENVVVKQCRIWDSVFGSNMVAKNLLVANCYMRGNVREFSRESFITVDHCFLNRYANEDNAQILFTNSIIGGGYASSSSSIGQYSMVRSCIFSENYKGFPGNTLIESYYRLNSIAPLFADVESEDYSETRTFELKDPDTYVGTDGTPIGPSGGFGWDKVPTKPSIKNLTTTVAESNLNVTYEAIVK